MGGRSGVWRRFDDVIFFNLPDKPRRMKIFEKYLRVMKKEDNFDLTLILDKTDKFSGSDIEQACIEALKRTILQGDDLLSFDTLTDLPPEMVPLTELELRQF